MNTIPIDAEMAQHIVKNIDFCHEEGCHKWSSDYDKKAEKRLVDVLFASFPELEYYNGYKKKLEEGL